MRRALFPIAFFSLFLALPARAAGARDGASVAVPQHDEVPTSPTSEPDVATHESIRRSSSAGPVRFTDKPFSMNVMLGVGTVVGGFGLVVEYNVATRFALGAGLGTSWFGPGSPFGQLQGGGFGRFRFLVSEDDERAQAFGAVAGFSTGNFNSSLFAGDEPAREQAYWMQLGLDYELVTRGGFRFAGGAGAAVLMGTSNGQYSYLVDQSKLPRLVLAIDLSVGWSL